MTKLVKMTDEQRNAFEIYFNSHSENDIVSHLKNDYNVIAHVYPGVGILVAYDGAQVIASVSRTLLAKTAEMEDCPFDFIQIIKQPMFEVSSLMDWRKTIKSKAVRVSLVDKVVAGINEYLSKNGQADAVTKVLAIQEEIETAHKEALRIAREKRAAKKVLESV